MLLNTSLVFDGKTLVQRIEDSSQLTRRVVHVDPGEIPVGLFNNFQIVCPQLHRRLLAKLATDHHCSEDEASAELYDLLRNQGSTRMLQALATWSIDGAMYRNMLVYIDHADLTQQRDQSLLMLMLFVITGCTGNPHTASLIVVDYATNVLGADYHTAQTICVPRDNTPEEKSVTLGLVRIHHGHILKGTPMHVLNPAGTIIGLMPHAKHTVVDVGEDVSLEHALVWRADDGRWYIRDLDSTNGTRVMSRATDTTVEVHDNPIAIDVTDTICLGTSTRFLVLPIMEAE